MVEVQATLEGVIRAHHFFNIDLFRRGYYAVATRLHVLTKLPFSVEVDVVKEKTSKSKDKDKMKKSDERSYVVNGGNGPSRGHDCHIGSMNESAESSIESGSGGDSSLLLFDTSPFRVVFRNEVIPVHVQSRFRLHVLLPIGQIQKCLDEQLKVRLELQLFFSDHPPTSTPAPSSTSAMSLVSTRNFQLAVDTVRGLHSSQCVLFDYFHMGAISVSVHSSLVSIHKPYIRPNSVLESRKGNKEANKRSKNYIINNKRDNSSAGESENEDIFFSSSTRGSAVIVADEQSARLINARRIHLEICSLLLQAFESLYNRLVLFCVHVDPDEDVAKWAETKADLAQCKQRLKMLTERAQKTELEEMFITLANNHMAQLSGELVMLWHAFLASVCKRHSDRVTAYMANEAHQMRVRRFSEGFFRSTHARSDMLHCEDKTKRTSLAAKTRGSLYFSSLPRPAMFCVDLDGDSSNVPIIFEDAYGDKDSNYDTLRPVVITDGDDECGHTMMETSIPSAIKGPKTEDESKRSKPSNHQRSGSYSNRNSYSSSESRNSINDGASRTRVNGFSHVTWSHSIPYNLAEEPDTNADVVDNDTDSRIGPPLRPVRRRRPFHPKASSLRRQSLSQEALVTQPCVTNHVLTHRCKSELHLTNAETAFQKPSELSLVAPSLVAQVLQGRRKSESESSKDCEERLQASALSLQMEHLLHRKEDNKAKMTEVEVRGEVKVAKDPTLLTSGSTFSSSSSSSSYEPLAPSATTRNTNSTVLSRRSSSPLVPLVLPSLLRFAQAKEAFKEEHLKQHHHHTTLYSEHCCITASSIARYLDTTMTSMSFNKDHLVVCVHGLDGNCVDLRLFKVYLEMAMTDGSLDFLMSEVNQSDTFQDLEAMTEKLVEEILQHIATRGRVPQRLSFIGHSLGAVLVRSAISRPQMRPLQQRFHTFLSLSGPHLGTLYNSSGIVNMGMWLMQKWKKSASLLQLGLRDAQDVRQTFLYRLSKRSNLHCFKHVLLAGSTQDRYVPSHSARIEICEAAVKDTSVIGTAYREMVGHILRSLLLPSCSTIVVRYDVQHVIATHTTNALIGRAAHIAVLDSELFVEKLLLVSALKYFM